MEIVYQSETMTVADGRELITPEKAWEILCAGGSINICNAPDYGAENECDMFDHGYDADFDFLEKQWEFAGLLEHEQRAKFLDYVSHNDLYEV